MLSLSMIICLLYFTGLEFDDLLGNILLIDFEKLRGYDTMTFEAPQLIEVNH